MHLENQLRKLALSTRLLADAPAIDRQAALTDLSDCLDAAAHQARFLERARPVAALIVPLLAAAGAALARFAYPIGKVQL